MMCINNHMFLLPFQLEKAGLALLTQDLEVAVTCQVGLQSSEGLPEAGHPPPWWLKHIATKLMWASWFLSSRISPKNCLCVFAMWRMAFLRTNSPRDQGWNGNDWHGLRYYTIFYWSYWLALMKYGEVYTMMWVLRGHFGVCCVLLLSFYLNFVILSSILSKDSLVVY